MQLVYSRSALQYLCLLLCVFLLEIIAGILAYITYQEVKKCCIYSGCHVTDIFASLQHEVPTLPPEAHIFFHDVSFHSFPLAVYLNSLSSTNETHLLLFCAAILSFCVHSVHFPNLTNFPTICLSPITSSSASLSATR